MDSRNKDENQNKDEKKLNNSSPKKKNTRVFIIQELAKAGLVSQDAVNKVKAEESSLEVHSRDEIQDALENQYEESNPSCFQYMLSKIFWFYSSAPVDTGSFMEPLPKKYHPKFGS